MCLKIFWSEEISVRKNFTVRQNTTIGVDPSEYSYISIGNNVDIGANTCLIAKGKVFIGDNVIIGAMSFVNKDIPSNSTYITKKTNSIIRH